MPVPQTGPLSQVNMAAVIIAASVLFVFRYQGFGIGGAQSGAPFVLDRWTGILFIFSYKGLWREWQ